MLGSINFTLFKGLLCAYSIFFSDFPNLRGKTFVFLINFSNFSTEAFDRTSNRTNALAIKLDVDTCKAGEIFDGEICRPCDRNSFLLEKDLNGSLYMCNVCNTQDNFNCYGGNQRSPKKNYWKNSCFVLEHHV